MCVLQKKKKNFFPCVNVLRMEWTNSLNKLCVVLFNYQDFRYSKVETSDDGDTNHNESEDY